MAKNNFQYGGRPPSWILKKYYYSVMWLESSSKWFIVYQISSKSDDSSLSYGDFHDRGLSPSWILAVQEWDL